MLIDVCFDDLSDLICVSKCCIRLCYNCYEIVSTSVLCDVLQ
jgi:hypothetical protein